MNVEIQHTLDFLQPYLKNCSSLLEVGCGTGELASVINKNLSVTAIDKSAEAVEAARALGVQAVQADFLTYDSPFQFDILFFSRSLHHIHPLDLACQQSLRLLKSNGLIILEDFAAEAVDEPTATWFYALHAELTAKHAIEFTHTDGESLLPLDRWRKHHFVDHAVSTSKEVLTSLSAQFHLEMQSTAPYLYRYFAKRNSHGSNEIAADIKQLEEAMISDQKIESIGWRAVFKKDN